MQTVIDQLQALYPDSSKTTLKKWIRNGKVLIGGKTATAPHHLVGTEKLTLASKKKDDFIVYEDDHIVVIDKPAGLLSVAAERGVEISAHKMLKERGHRVYPVHRLDKYASGLLVFAYTHDAKEGLKTQFAAHSVERIYLALVEGTIDSPGTWESHLWEDATYRVHSSKRRGKLAITHYTPLKHNKETTLLQVKLETGRKNQIRVHCADAGHPIVGDTKYGVKEQHHRRIFLHAHTLSFIHPITKERITLSSKPPHRLH